MVYIINNIKQLISGQLLAITAKYILLDGVLLWIQQLIHRSRE